MHIDEKAEAEIKGMIQETVQETFTAPIMLVLFVENAFKHGTGLKLPSSWIYITLTLCATQPYLMNSANEICSPES